MPIREACHVAVQRSLPGKQRLWKHALARKENDTGPVVQIVCSYPMVYFCLLLFHTVDVYSDINLRETISGY